MPQSAGRSRAQPVARIRWSPPRRRTCALAALVVLALPSAAAAPLLSVADLLQAPASAGSRPLARINMLKEPPDGSGRLFLNDLRGTLYAIDGGTLHSYLDLATLRPALKTAPGLATGFVSFAFDPEFATSGLLYTVHTEVPGAIPPNQVPAEPTTIVHHAVLTEWTASDPSANAFSGSSRELMRVAAPHHFHNIGEIAFDPNAGPADPDYRLLYIAQGDYGSVAIGEPEQLQRLDTIYGAILRIDPLGGPFLRGGITYDYGIPPDNPLVDGDPDTFDEIYAYGFRNAHRLAWDTAGNGTLFATDVGEDDFEEIDVVVPMGNYGWPEREGIMVHDPLSPGSVSPLPGNDASFGYRYPVAIYDHASGGRAIAGGIPYRGSLIPDLAGRFLLGDIVTGDLMSAGVAELEAMDDGDPSTLAALTPVTLQLDGQATSLLQIVRDAAGNQALARADLRLAVDLAGEIAITTKQDGFVRALPEPSGSLAPGAGLGLLALLARRRCWRAPSGCSRR